MPPDPAPRRGGTDRRTRRRSVLHAAVLGLVGASLAACGVRWEDLRVDDVATPTPPEPSPDDLARFGAVVAVQALLDLATAVTDPAAQVVADRHRAHLAQLGPLPGPVPSPSSTPSGWPTTSPPPMVTPDLATLAAAELEAAARLIGSAAAPDAQVDGALALLVVSVGVSCRVTAAGLGTQVAPSPLPEDVDPSGLRSADEQLAAVVEAHRAAAYGYGVLAVRLTGGARDAGRTAIDSHRRAALHLVGLAVQTGAAVPPAQPAYVVPSPADAAVAQALALALELDVATAAGALVAASTGQWRALAADHLSQVSLDARAWGAVPDFPGAPGLG